MATVDLLSFFLRWLHILAAGTALGGAIFVRFVVLPSDKVLSAGERETLHSEMRRRWSKIVMAAIGFLLLSGFYNFFVIVDHNRGVLPKWYHPVFGVKFLLALAVFTIASLLSGRTPLAARLRTQSSFWLSLNIALITAIIGLSGLLRLAHPPAGEKVVAPAAAFEAAPAAR